MASEDFDRGDGREESDWGVTMNNSPNLGPLESLRVAWRRLRNTPVEREHDWRRCTRHSLPAVCLGADLANPEYRCPRCCRLDPQYGSDGMTVYGGRTAFHGRDDYLVGHKAAEGINL
ncbi:hypothetical protein [Halobacterium sp. CBA1126]|uniref:hypothetical protein n=1 Tax=Halobacterium sp. CBA1126 TaxID=2668074 RepID=UPI0012FC9B2E|nr:hypothetical protein [Halobacterium sp. CBA1126]MUV61722.1 hypothetical protein [Halobacterium sp. CBA1126]